MAASDSRPIPRKNTAFRAYFNILDADGDPVTGASSLDSEVSIDGAAFADCTSEATEIGTTGMYYLDLTAAEMNGDGICVQVKTATSGAKTTQLVFYPEEAGDVRVDVVQISGDATAADNLEAAADGNGYNLGGGSVVAASVTGAVGSVTGNVGGNVTGSVGSVVGAVGSVAGNVGGNVNGNVVGSVASVTAGVTLADDAITASKFDESTAFPLKANDAGATQVARTGADGDTLETLSDQSDAIKSDSAAILLDTGTDGVVVASASKSGYSLSATGLDSITASDPGGVASTFPQMVVQLWRRFFKKTTLTTTQLKTYADDGTTVNTTQTVSDDGTTQTQGDAS